MSHLIHMFSGKLSNFNRNVLFGNEVEVSNKFLDYSHNVWKMEGGIVYDRAPDCHLTISKVELYVVE